MNQRDAQRLATRRALSAAAIRRFHADGYDETRVGDIAAEVGVSERTFFLHFPTKDRSVFPDHGERVAALQGLLAASPMDLDPFEIMADQIRFGLRSTTESEVRATRYRLIASVDALRERDVINDLDYEVVFAEFLLDRWPPRSNGATLVSPQFHSRMLAGATMATARASLTNWAADPRFDPIAATTSALETLRPWPSARTIASRP